MNDIIACFNYLRGLGSASCVATRGIDGVQMCRAGSAQIVGWSISNRQAASHWSVYRSTPMPVASPNPCLLLSNDVASAVLWTIDSCTRPNQSCAGTFYTLYYLMPESFQELVTDADNTQGVKRHGEMGISSSPPSTSTGERRKPREKTDMLRTVGYSAVRSAQSTDTQPRDIKDPVW